MKKILIAITAGAFFFSCEKDPESGESMKETDLLLETAAQQRGMNREDFMKTLVNTGKFTAQQNVFFLVPWLLTFQRSG